MRPFWSLERSPPHCRPFNPFQPCLTCHGYSQIGWHDRDENSSGALTTRLATDASYVRGAVGDTLGLIVQNLTCLALGYLISFA